MTVNIFEMKNTIKNYAWGSKIFLSKLMRTDAPINTPQAELWMGTHKQGVSKIKRIGDKDHTWDSLENIITEQKEQMLGRYVAKNFEGQLPFLFKVLAIDHPLSIQVHPNAKQAKQGFANENRQSIPLTAASRNFKDEHDKPELIVALTPLWAMCGFLPFETIKNNFKTIAGDYLFKIKHSEKSSNEISTFFYNLLHLSNSEIRTLITYAVNFASKQEDKIHWQWVKKLSSLYKDDVGVLAPLFLNTVCLKPYEAIFIQPGVLHAYLDGNAVEIMCNSDNVIRGGLTVKHIDKEKLIEIVTFNSEEVHYIEPVEKKSNEWLYKTPAISFLLSRYNIKKIIETIVKGPEILLCIKGEVIIRQNNVEHCLKSGMSVFVAHSAKSYTLDGNGEIFKAFIENQE